MRRRVADRRVGARALSPITCVEIKFQAPTLPRNCICSMAWSFHAIDATSSRSRGGSMARRFTEHILRMKKYELYLPLEPQALDLALRSALQRLCQGIPELLERVEVGRPVRICHQEQRSRVSRVVF